MKTSHITIKKITLTKIGIFLAFLFSYNYTIRSIVYNSSLIDIFICIVSILLLLISNFKRSNIKKNNIKLFLISIIMLAFILVRNGDISNGNYGMPSIACWSIILMCILNFSTKWIKDLKIIFILFTIEHTFFTWFFYFFKNIYLNSFIVKFDSETMWLLRYQATNGFMAGLTSHYSTNAIYLSIGVIFLFCLLLNYKQLSKQKIMISILFVFTLGALLLTGKRAQLIFSIFAIVVIYIAKDKKNLEMKFMKVLSLFVVGIIFIIVCSTFIPELLNVYDRMISLGNSNDVTNGRSIMYELAFNEWKKHPITGTGWGTYKYIYKENIKAKDGYLLKDVHNVYLQLLSEIGIIGFLFFVIMIFYAIINTFVLIINVQSYKESYDRWKMYLLFSFGIQLFFVLYCITGNALYDCQILFPYVIAISIMLSLNNKIKRRRVL